MPKPRKSGMRRAYLKKYNQPSSVTGANVTVISEYAQRAKSAGKELPQTKGYLGHNVHVLNQLWTPLRERTKALHKLWEGQKTEYHCVLVNTPLRKVCLYFTGFSNKETYWFTWYDPILEREKESITYGAKSIAMRHFQLNSITWK